MVKMTGEVIETFFWDAHGLIYSDYLEEGKTVSFVTAAIQHRNRDKKRSPFVKEKVPLPQTQYTGAQLCTPDWKLWNCNSNCSNIDLVLDLSPSDFLFQDFSSDENV